VYFTACQKTVSSTCQLAHPTPPTPPKPPPDANKELKDSCKSDIDNFCEGDGPVLVIYCLYAHKDQLKISCQDYLGSTTIGACNEDAKKICGDYDSTKDIMNCLESHSEELSADCLRNIENAARNPLRRMEESTLISTKIVTNFSLLFLAIPMVIVIVAFCQMYRLYLLQEVVLNEQPSVWKRHSDVVEVIRACDSIEEVQSSKHPWCISFHAIDYWAVEIESWMNPSKMIRKKILSNVS
jgi:hypothetical protein